MSIITHEDCRIIIQEKLQSLAAKGAIIVDRNDTRNVVTIYDEERNPIGQSIGDITAFGDYTHEKEDLGNGLVSITIYLDEIPGGEPFRNLYWPFEERVQRGYPIGFDIIMRSDDLFDTNAEESDNESMDSSEDF